MRNHYPDLGLLIIRLGTGLSYPVLHGWDKLVGGPDYWTQIGENMQYLGITFGYLVFGFLAACTETFAALLLALGLFSRLAAFLLFGMMFVAVNTHLGSGQTWYDAAHALHMLFVFLGLIALGPGRYSLDAWWSRRHARPASPAPARTNGTPA